MAGELMPCGTPAAYERHLQHGETPCEACRAAKAAYNREQRARLSRRPAWQVPHGLGGYNNWGCRCAVCTAANSSYRRQWYARRKQQAAEQ